MSFRQWLIPSLTFVEKMSELGLTGLNSGGQMSFG